MKGSNRKRHRPGEVVAKLRRADEALAKGVPIAEVARSLGVSAVTLHPWRAEYGAVDRDELLSSEIFGTLAEARYLADRWRLRYNHRRSQRTLGKKTPAAYKATCPAIPPLRLAPLAYAAAPPGREGADTMHPLS